MRRAAAMAIVGLVVAGCGGVRLDATDHETLKASFKRMTDGMEAAEKEALGKDLLLIMATEAKKQATRPGGRPPGVPASTASPPRRSGNSPGPSGRIQRGGSGLIRRAASMPASASGSRNA